MSIKAKVNLVINDTHCGSEHGLLPEMVTLEDGRGIGYHKNKKLEYLWKAWLQMREDFFRIVGNDPYVFTLNGDIIEGNHHGSDETVAARVTQHLTIAKEALGPFVEMAETTIVTRGTECHTKDFETLFCRMFGLEDAKDFQQYEVNGCLVDARHHMPVTRNAWAEAGAMSQVMHNTISNCVRAGHPVPRVFLRAHRHLTGDYSDGKSMIVVPAAWQWLTRHCYKVCAESIPRFSAYVLDWRYSPEGGLPARHCLVYDPPFDVLNS